MLGDKADYLLYHTSKTIDKSTLHLPSPDVIDNLWVYSNRNNNVLRNFQSLLNFGRLAGTGYCSIFPVDQGIEHSAGSAFAPNPMYFDP
jgi:class I fructose-bisphosphate aldolase